MIELEESALTSEEYEAVIQSRGFQKMLLYHRLSEGIDVLEEHDLLVEALVESITKQHSQVDSEAVSREFLSLFAREVRTYTAPLDEELVDQVEIDILGDESKSESRPSRTEDAETLRAYLDSQLEETDSLELKAKEIAESTGLNSTYVGSLLGRWRKEDDPPFRISASETPGSGNTWEIRKLE